MGYVALPLLEAAVDHLSGKHVLAVLVLPAMLRAGVTIQEGAEQGTPYGSGDELQLLRDFFTVPGAPPDEPFRAVWEPKPQHYWRDERYAGRALQRVRTDRVGKGLAFLQMKQSPGPDLWALRDSVGQDVMADVGDPVRLVDLAIWFGRDRDVTGLDDLVAWFKDEFSVEAAGLVGTLYTEDVPPHYTEIPFAPEPISQTEYAAALGGAPAATVVEADLASLVDSLAGRLQTAGYVVAGGLVESVLSAWLRGDIVVLVGQPGTGKTSFANHIERGLRAELGDLRRTWVAVRPDFDEAELLGYERLDGSAELKEFAVTVLKSAEPLSPHLVVLDEFNVAMVETYFARVLVATEEIGRRVLLPAGEDATLPVDTFVLATCNSYLDEPETRVRVSYATKRRMTVITMPNVLYEKFNSDGDGALVELSLQLIAQRRTEVEERVARGLGATFDELRLPGLSSIGAESDLSEEVRMKLRSIGSWILGTSEGRDFFTMGLLRDVALEIAFAPRNSEAELRALGRAVADKLVHQLRGPKSRADDFHAQVSDLPNADHIARLLDRMKAGPGDQLLPLL